MEITFYDLREKKVEPKRLRASEERSRYDEDDYYEDTPVEEPETVTGPRALVGMGQLSAAKRERDKERRRQKEIEFKRQRERERVKKEPVRRALPSEPSIPSADPNSAEAKKKEQKLRERERENEKNREKQLRERQLREREKRGAQRNSRQPEDYRELRERQHEKERERRKRRETYAGGEYERDRDEYVNSRRSKHTRGISHSPIPPQSQHPHPYNQQNHHNYARSGRGPSPIPPHRGGDRGDRGPSPLPPHRGGDRGDRGPSPLPPHRGGDRGDRGPSPLPPYRGGDRGDRGPSPLPPYRDGDRGDRGPSPLPPYRGGRGPSPIPPRRGDRGHSPIFSHHGNTDPREYSPVPPFNGNNDTRGCSPIPPRRGDREGQSPIPPSRMESGGQSPIPPMRSERAGNSPIPPHRRLTAYEVANQYGVDQYPTDYDDIDDSYGSQLQLQLTQSQPAPLQISKSLQTQPFYSNPNTSKQQLYSNPNPNPNNSIANLYSHPNSSATKLYSHPNSSFVDLPVPDGPPPPPPPHRHIQGQSSNPQLRHQPSMMMNNQPPQLNQLLLKHQPSNMTLKHKPSQMQIAMVNQKPPRQLKHQASVADWAASHDIEIAPQKVPQAPPALPPKVSQLQGRPRAPSSTYTSAPDFEALSKPDAPNNDEFDDTGRFVPGALPPKPTHKITQKSDIDTLTGDGNSGALVPAGYNYGTANLPAYRKPFGNLRPRSDSDSTAMVITSQKQRPPPPQYNSAANSRRNSFIGIHPIPPSLIPGIDPTLAELIADDERRQWQVTGVQQSTASEVPQQQESSGQSQLQQPHAPPAPYVEEVNDREDGGRRRSANGAVALKMIDGKGPADGLVDGPTQAQAQTQLPALETQLVKHRVSYRPPPKQLEQYPLLSHKLPLRAQAHPLTLAAKSDAPLVAPSNINSAAANNSNRGVAEALLPPIEPPPQPPSRAKTKRLDGIPFNPDAYNIINPKPSKMPPPTRGGTIIRTANGGTMASTTMIATNSRKPDEILPPETFAPEPEPKPKSAATLQAEFDAEMQLQLRKARGVNGAREMALAQTNLPPAYPAPKFPISIPERGSSSRTGTKKRLALPPTDSVPPPPPPGHQTLTIVQNPGNISPTKAGTVRSKLQKLRPQKSTDMYMATSPSGQPLSGYLNQAQQQQQQAASLSMQIAQHEARMKREAEHAAQRRVAAEARTRELKTHREAAAAAGYRHSMAGPPPSSATGTGGLAGYTNSYARHSMAALPGPPGFADGNSSIGGEDDGTGGAMVLHRHRSAEPIWDGGGRRSYDGSYNLSRAPSHNELNDGYDQGIVLYRPSGGGSSQGNGSGPGTGVGEGNMGYGGGGYTSGYGSNMSTSGSAASRGDSARGGAPPPIHAPRGPTDIMGGYSSGGGEHPGGGYDESMALMSREEWLLSQELRGISIGVGNSGGRAGGGGGTVARRSGGRGY